MGLLEAMRGAARVTGSPELMQCANLAASRTVHWVALRPQPPAPTTALSPSPLVASRAALFKVPLKLPDAAGNGSRPSPPAPTFPFAKLPAPKLTSSPVTGRSASSPAFPPPGRAAVRLRPYYRPLATPIQTTPATPPPSSRSARPSP